jgi:predicted SAM-dependent methyltransferase
MAGAAAMPSVGRGGRYVRAFWIAHEESHMDFKHTRISLSRSITDYTKVQRLIATAFRNRYINKSTVSAKEYLDIGCGPNTHEQFINMDYSWHPNIDICWDVTKGIPLPDESVTGIFSEHCLEHLPFESMNLILRECYRVLKPGGSIRIVMPDGELYLTRYAEIIRGKLGLALPYAEGHSVEGIYSPIITVNRIFRHHGHLFIYDSDLLRQLLLKNGLVQIKKEEYRSGRDPQLLIDSEHRAIESFYMEASRPTHGTSV